MGKFPKYRNFINYDTNTQICKECKRELDLTPENFGIRRDYPSGYDKRCRECSKKMEITKALKYQRLNDDNLWTCSMCGKELELNKENFYRRADSITGFSYRCKKCVQSDPSRFDRRQDSENLEYYLKDLLWGIRSRTKKKNIICDLDLNFLLELYKKQEGRCAISNLKMTHAISKGRIKTNISVDRIIPSMGYIKSNIQLVCIIINVMKSDMTMDELKGYCTLILQRA